MAANRVLLVDDHADLLEVLADAFRRAGFETALAENGEEAVALFRIASFDAVMTDIIMPRREGFETIRDIRALSDRAVIVAMSGGSRMGQDMLKDVALALGADGFFNKPFLPSEAIGLIKGLLAERAGQRLAG